MPRSPAMASIGSPGTRRIRKKATSVIPMKVGITWLMRTSAKRTIATPAGSRLYVDTVEGVPRERARLEVDHFLAHWHQLHRMGDGKPGGLLLEDDLRLAVERGALRLVGYGLGLGDQLLEGLITELGDVAATGLGGSAAEQRVEEIVGIAVVAGPAELPHLVLAVLQPFAVLAPFEALDLGLDAYLGEVGLHQLGNAARIGIVRPLHRHGPQIGREAVGIAGLGEKLLGCRRIEGIILDVVVVGPHRGG